MVEVVLAGCRSERGEVGPPLTFRSGENLRNTKARERPASDVVYGIVEVAGETELTPDNGGTWTGCTGFGAGVLATPDALMPGRRQVRGICGRQPWDDPDNRRCVPANRRCRASHRCAGTQQTRRWRLGAQVRAGGNARVPPVPGGQDPVYERLTAALRLWRRCGWPGTSPPCVGAPLRVTPLARSRGSAGLS